MRKRVLEQNILPTAKQRIVVQGLAAADILLISRDPIDMKLGVIALPDQTRVPGGRRRAALHCPIPAYIFLLKQLRINYTDR